MSKNLVITLDYEIHRTDFFNILDEIYNVYPNVEFLGWIDSCHSIEIEEETYKVFIRDNLIVLKHTTNKRIVVHKRGRKAEMYPKYVEFLDKKKKLRRNLK